MKNEIAELVGVSHGYSLRGIRWGAVMAGMAVGAGTYVLLMLLGVCAGLAEIAAAKNVDMQAVMLLCNLASALIASMVGGGLAARAADLRRNADGVMHGLVVWGVTTLLVVVLSLLAMREMTGGVPIMTQQSPDQTSMGRSNREGWTRPPRGAGALVQVAEVRVDRRPDTGRPVYRDWTPGTIAVAAPAQRAMDPSMFAALLFCAAVGMSLCGGIAGGVLGTQRPRRPDPLDHANWREQIDLLER